jgi:hypothetical protein
MSQPDSWYKGHTPNWGPEKRYTLINISVKIQDGGQGLTREQAAKLCKRFEKIAMGQSKQRIVSAMV